MNAGATASSSAARPLTPVRVLLRNVVDYAGLFPPASLSMDAAVREYAAQRSGDDAWLLGRFVLPAARLDEFELQAGAALPHEGANSWALSALLSGDIEEDVARVALFNERHRDARDGAVQVDTVELKAQTVREIARACELLDGAFDTYVEIPTAEDPTELVAAIGAAHVKAKIRTGGVTPDLFPASANIVRFARACIAGSVAFKATAGLHHSFREEYPLTYAPDAARGTMFGFLNVLLCVTALCDGVSNADAVALLEECDARSVTFGDDGVRWRGRHLSHDALARARESMTAFGSCSFREPVAELRSLGLL
ncbi:MAG TPA: hypothetical protein VJ867_14165 [Gemmatimonadaceae bacterium]|nr:hypothetical protein [Gemmatimonadaceae bacterium]